MKQLKVFFLTVISSILIAGQDESFIPPKLQAIPRGRGWFCSNSRYNLFICHRELSYCNHTTIAGGVPNTSERLACVPATRAYCFTHNNTLSGEFAYSCNRTMAACYDERGIAMLSNHSNSLVSHCQAVR